MFSINGENWDVIFVPSNSDYLMRIDGTYSLAVTDDDLKTIFISNEVTDGCKLKRILIHEICHCVMFSMNIYMDIYSEEILCSVIENYGKMILCIANKLIEKIDGES